MNARIIFDTLHYANRLKAAGLESKIAEEQAEANADMIANLLDNGLVTQKDLSGMEVHFDTKLDAMEARFDTKLDAMEARFDTKLDAMEARIDTKFAALEARTDAKFAAMEIRIDDKFAKVDARFITLEESIKQKFLESENRLLIKLGTLMLGGITVVTLLATFAHRFI